MNFVICAIVVSIVILIVWNLSRRMSRKIPIHNVSEIRKQLLDKWPSSVDINVLIDVPVAYINLDKSTARYDHMQNIFDTYKLLPRPVRIPGVLGEDYIKNPETEPWIAPSLHHHLVELVKENRTTSSELGCLLSHLKAILHGYRSKFSSLLIVEDDVDFSCVGLWKDSLSSLIRQLPDWNFVQLYYDCSDYDYVLESELTELGENIQCTGAVAYLISAQCMESLYNLMFTNFVLTTHMYHVLQEKGRHFSSDLAIYNILHPRKVYIEHLQRFAMDNFDSTLNSTIHTSHTQQHQGFTTEIWNKYLQRRLMSPPGSP